jgi:hypothetical protein
MVPMAPVAGYGTPFVPFAGGGGMSFSMSMQGDMSLALPLLGRLASAVFSPNIEPIRNDLLSFLAGRIPGDAMTKADALKLLEELDKRLEKRFQSMEDLVKSSAKGKDGKDSKDGKDATPKPVGRSPELDRAEAELRASLDKWDAAPRAVKSTDLDRVQAELQVSLDRWNTAPRLTNARKLDRRPQVSQDTVAADAARRSASRSAAGAQ